MRLDELFITLLNMSITAGYAAVAVMLLRLLLKKAPRWISCALWGLVGLRLVLPFSLKSVLSLIPSADTVTKDILYAAQPSIHSGFPALNSTVNPAITGALAPAADAVVSPLQSLMSAAAVVWLLGLLAMAAWSMISYLKLRGKVASAVLLRDNIYESDAVVSPFVLGVIRPKIYLPFDLGGAERGYVIAHEKTHIRRKDHWIKPLGFLLLAVYWFNPVLWLAYILLCRDIELACDEAVIKNIGGDGKKAYSTALLDCAVNRRSIAMCPLAFGEVGLRERVKNVLSYKRPAFWIIAVAVIASAVAAVCLLTNPKTDDAAAGGQAFARELFSYRTDYADGNTDAANVTNIVRLLSFPSDVKRGPVNIVLDSASCRVRVDFNISPEARASYDTPEPRNIKTFRANACTMLALVRNAELVTFRLEDGSGNTLGWHFTRSWAESVVGADLWAESGSPKSLDRLLARIDTQLDSAYAAAPAAVVEGLPTGTFTPAGLVYLGPWFSATQDAFLAQNKNRTFVIGGGSFDGGDAAYKPVDVGNIEETFGENFVPDNIVDILDYDEKACWSVLTPDGEDTGYRVFRMDGEVWIGHWDRYGASSGAWWCEYIFRLGAAGESVGSPLPSADNLPRGYDADASDDGTLYSWEGDSLTTRGYIGWIDKPVGWLVLKGEIGLGSEDAYVYLTHDGGETWTELGSANSKHRMAVTGAGFASEQVGFLSYRYYEDAGPDIWRTTDGGGSWSPLTVSLPETYRDDGYRFTPLSPTFDGPEGVYPILVFKEREDGNYDQETIAMYSHDGGLIWSFEDAADPEILAPAPLACPSPDGAYTAEAYGTNTSITAAGLYPYEGLRLVRNSDETVLWNGPGYYRAEFLWSGDSRYVAVYGEARTWGECFLVEAAAGKAVALPGMDAVSARLGDEAQPAANRPDPYFKAAEWVDDTTIRVDYKWITQEGGKEVSGTYDCDIVTGDIVSNTTKINDAPG